ncbi:hypothetical protein ACH3XW_8360 [Acanthocheilonema viteae]
MISFIFYVTRVTVENQTNSCDLAITFSCRISTILRILNQILFFAKLITAKKTVIMNETINKLLDEERLDQVHIALFKYNFTSNSYLQQCGKPLLYIRDRFRKKIITVELSNKRCIIRTIHHCLIYRIKPSCVFKRIIFVLRRNDIKLQLDCQSNIIIIQQAELESNNITVLEVFDDDSCRNGVDFIQTIYNIVSFDSVSPFLAKQSNDSFVRAMKEVKENKKKGFHRDLRYHLKWVYLCLEALTIIISAATILMLIVEFHFQRQHYLAKHKPLN